MAKTLTTSEAAAALGLSLPRVHQLIQAGELPAERFGNAYMIRRADLAKVKRRPVGRPPLPKGSKKKG